MNTQIKKISLGFIIALGVFIGMTLSAFTQEQAFLMATISFMVTLWSNEGLSLAVVSLLPIILFPAFGILSTKATTINYAHPIIYLFLGGFLLAIAVEKSNLHKWMANKILALFPSSARGLVFALIITSGLLSSVLSNTTTTLLLLPLALFLTDNPMLKVRFVLAIAYGANVGGILTPIGTPPNLVFLGLVQELGLEPVPFTQWIWMVAPLVFVMFIVVGLLLSYGIRDIKIDTDLNIPALNYDQKKILYLLGGMILLLLVNAPIKPYYDGLGLSEAGILLAAGLLLFMPPFSILEWDKDSHKIPFAIIFLFGAGFSIAKAFSQTGMADVIATYLVGLSDFPIIIFMFSVAFLVTFTTEITSNTALISIMLPILYSVSEQIGLDARLFMMMATVCASFAFMLPIATPPNAIAMSSGVVHIKQMATYGIFLNLIGIFSIVIIANFFWRYVL